MACLFSLEGSDWSLILPFTSHIIFNYLWVFPLRVPLRIMSTVPLRFHFLGYLSIQAALLGFIEGFPLNFPER